MPGRCHHLSPAGTARKEKATQNWALGQTVEPHAWGWPLEKKGPGLETVLCCVTYQDLAGYVLANERAPASQATPLGEAHWPYERIGGGSLGSPEPITLALKCGALRVGLRELPALICAPRLLLPRQSENYA